VEQIGEDVIGSRVSGFVACFGHPINQRDTLGSRCFYYRERSAETFWKFCARDGRIVSALGSLPRPG
jgi:hypothetical protein